MKMNKEIISFKNSIIVDLKTQEAVKTRASTTIRKFKTTQGVTCLLYTSPSPRA